ncbi:hypothetical protein [Corynebacterium durum]|uniref:hypothetical protein n=1 Tax=Corynebacterium durum TaxID=61592 RepID=UPI00288B2861|nr:hypothetical protein [Corynebacterium durum]
MVVTCVHVVNLGTFRPTLHAADDSLATPAITSDYDPASCFPVPGQTAPAV